ncbi:hypothetical protein DUI87_07194 [Hirundo rustica rustica]|uniref:Uncharacterized protein n=1 Tax=Hirundo rustica rustica TaxID=333673 RepID=A0A3M0KPH2_HIRRU|nr:hypothetical protein DUI87_07194 [Hirundo rustica rustica]
MAPDFFMQRDNEESKSAADLCGVVDRHKTSDTVPWPFMATAVQMVCVTEYTETSRNYYGVEKKKHIHSAVNNGKDGEGEVVCGSKQKHARRKCSQESNISMQDSKVKATRGINSFEKDMEGSSLFFALILDVVPPAAVESRDSSALCTANRVKARPRGTHPWRRLGSES